MEDHEVFVAVFVALLVLVGVGSCTYAAITVQSINGADGQHTGYVTAVEHNVNWWAFDSDLAYFKTDTQSTQEDVYCMAKDDALRDHLRQVADAHQRVTIHFHHDPWLRKWDCNGGLSIIVSVQEEDTPR